MSRERRTNFTSSEPDKPASSPARRTGTVSVNRRTGHRMTTANHASVAPKTGAYRPASRRSSPLPGLVILVVLAGAGYYFYSQYQEQKEAKKLAAQTMALEEKKIREERERRLLAEEKEKRRLAEAERLKAQEEKEKQQREAELAGFGKVAKKEVQKETEEEEAVETGEVVASAEFLEAMKEAEVLLKKGDWGAADARYADAAKAVAPENDQEKAKKLSESAQVFKKLTAETARARESIAEDLYLVTLKNGDKFRGKLDKNYSSVDDVKFIKDSGAAILLPPADIREKKLMTQEERDREMVEDLGSRKGKAGADAVAWFLCAVKALEYGQKPISVECFNEAVTRDPHIGRTASEFLAARLFASAMFDRQIKKMKCYDQKIKELKEKYPDSRAVKSIEGTLAEADALAAALAEQKAERARLAKMKKAEAAAARAERKRQREQSQNKALAQIEDDINSAITELGEAPVHSDKDTEKADTMLSRADDLIKTAQTCNSRDVQNQSYKDAVENLRQSAALYQRILNERNDPAIERKLESAQKKLYWCRKLQTL